MVMIVWCIQIQLAANIGMNCNHCMAIRGRDWLYGKQYTAQTTLVPKQSGDALAAAACQRNQPISDCNARPPVSLGLTKTKPVAPCPCPSNNE